MSNININAMPVVYKIQAVGTGMHVSSKKKTNVNSTNNILLSAKGKIWQRYDAAEKALGELLENNPNYRWELKIVPLKLIEEEKLKHIVATMKGALGL